LAWRPSETEDVDFAWTMGPADPPVTMGVRNLMQWSLSARVYGYE